MLVDARVEALGISIPFYLYFTTAFETVCFWADKNHDLPRISVGRDTA